VVARESSGSNFQIEFLDRASIPDLIRLQKAVAAALPSPELFILHGEDYFQDIFNLPRTAIGAFCQGRLIAYCFINIPGPSPQNLGRDLNLPDEELSRVAHLQAAAVHPDYRGHGLQKRLMLECLTTIEDMGYRHVCCTVSPNNPVSLKNILSCGLMISALRPKSFGWCRYIMHKDLGNFQCRRLSLDRPSQKPLEREMKSNIVKHIKNKKMNSDADIEAIKNEDMDAIREAITDTKADSKMNFKSLISVGSQDLKFQSRLLKSGFVGFMIVPTTNFEFFRQHSLFNDMHNLHAYSQGFDIVFGII